MFALILKRFGAAALIMAILTGVLFWLQRFATGDPIRTRLGAGASQEVVDATREQLGLNDPLLVQYVRYLAGVVQGDLGVSLRTGRPVQTDLAMFVPATAELTLTAFGIAMVMAVLFAVASAMRWPGGRVFRVLLTVGGAIPSFLVAIAGIIVFYKYLGWLPATGRTSLPDPPAGPTGLLTVDALLHGRFDVLSNASTHLLLPATVLALAPALAIGRVLRSSILVTLASDHIRTARVVGLNELSIVTRHVVRNSVGPALSMAGLQLGLMFAAVLVVETVFAWPGLGQYVALSIPVDDFPATAGVVLLMATGYVAINTVVDILQAAADPRIAL
ncbi:ABC transporter permease [Mycolicibacterium austroafricanum]|uniref:ABC transporter permease n=1 Tax=Mycolicibacterium austroafricanum TaxID=39687 RepID=A0ABT8HAF1_MYCAO|nr:ABC transporter permease [Mycolicibacterium austroafricanum]MDN4517732.1 ABC transporter permease [Mycolicibacterium austroafricanum]PQP47749.1 ABC transporter permease [Mycolicibacterium austroafricanum]QRZ08879.1 ABC transporter permease [Mycolicibacterium austroafricanum]QZT70654.1 ABC transporter permease [Mycolicibacterium austroafricanum]